MTWTWSWPAVLTAGGVDAIVDVAVVVGTKMVHVAKTMIGVAAQKAAIADRVHQVRVATKPAYVEAKFECRADRQ